MKSLTILVVPIDCVGHVNACAGATRPLLERGHRVIFFLETAFKGKLAALGFEEELYQLSTSTTTSAGESWANDILENGILGPNSVEEKYTAIFRVFHDSPRAWEVVRRSNEFVKKAIARVQPDLIWFDAAYALPAIYYSGIPFVVNMSLGPALWLSADNDEIPPNASGFPSNAPRDDRWRAFKKLNRAFKYSTALNDFVEQCGHARYPKDLILPVDDALLTVYAFPEEYNYPSIRETGWFNLEVFNKKQISNGTVAQLKSIVPESFFTDTLSGTWSGKWVYLSLGSMGSVDLSLMRRLLSIISSAKHKFIVSLGPRAADLMDDVPDNAWGAQYLPQTALVPQMDLVITHGGNNTVTETFAQGVPMILLPLFCDQYDNAQRLQELGLGIRVDPYDFQKEDLLGAIESILTNETLKTKLKAASKRLQTNRRHEELAETVEKLMEIRKLN